MWNYQLVDYIDTSVVALPHKLLEPIKFDAKIKELKPRCVYLQLLVVYTSICSWSVYDLDSLIRVQVITCLN
jgi:hypothetical protein